MQNPTSVIALLSLLCVSLDSAATVAGFEDWRHDKPCGEKLAEPVQMTTAECETELCITISDKSQVCACPTVDDEGVTRMTYKENGEVRLRWDSLLYPSGDTSAFRIDAADLNGDGEDELVIGTRSAVSDGMAVEHWSVRVLSREHLSEPLDVEDYGTLSFLTSNGKQCRLLEARWIEGWEPVRGYGLYLVGRWMELSDGDFMDTFNRPMIKRRYLRSLEQQRSQGDQKPVIWFNGPGASPIVGPYPFSD